MKIKKRYQKVLLNSIKIELNQINSGFAYIYLYTNDLFYDIGYYLPHRDKITLFDSRKTSTCVCIYLNVLHNSNKKWFKKIKSLYENKEKIQTSLYF